MGDTVIAVLPASNHMTGWSITMCQVVFLLESYPVTPLQCADGWVYLAKHVAKADSGTCGPHTGSSPLHLVLAFWRAALSHSSRPRASLPQGEDQMGINSFVLLWNGRLNISRYMVVLVLPDSCQMAVIVDDVKVRHSAVALLLPRLVFKVLQGHALREGVNTQDFGWLGQRTQRPKC